MEQTIVKRKPGNPNWHKGMRSPNPDGAGLTYKKLSCLFTSAFLRDKEKNQNDLFEYAFARARENDKILATLLNKFVPDLIKGEGFGDTNYSQIFQSINPERIRGLIASCRESTRDERTS